MSSLPSRVLQPTNVEYRGFTHISDEDPDRIVQACGTTDAFIRNILDYQGDGITTQPMLAPDWSEEVAVSSLAVDDVVPGAVEEVIPDREGRSV